MGMMLTGKPITAAEALRLGLVNEVVPSAELMATAERWAHEITECSPLSVQATKQAALQGLGKPLPEALDDALRRRWPASGRAQDSKEGPRAFAQKRKPRLDGTLADPRLRLGSAF